MRNNPVFDCFQRKYFENLCWIRTMIQEHKKEKTNSRIWNKFFSDGAYSLVLFDNYRYYTGAVIYRKGGYTVKISCPAVMLDLHRKSVHWTKVGGDVFDRLKAVTEPGFKGGVGLVLMDIRHFVRIMKALNPLEVFIKLSYNGIIYTELPPAKWLALRLYGIFGKKNRRRPVV